MPTKNFSMNSNHSVRALFKQMIPVLLALTATASNAAELTFGYVPGNLAYPYNVSTAKGFEAAAKAAGVKAVIIDPRGSVEKQGNALDDMIAQRVDAIGFLPLDSVVAQSFVDKIVDHEIPVAAIAVMVGDPQLRAINKPYEQLAALVTTDDIRAGEVAGEYSATLLPKDRVAKIAVVEGVPGYAVVKQLTEGFKTGLKKAGAKYEIVASQPTDWTPEQGERVCQNMLTAHPDLDLIFSQAEDMAIGCARALVAQGSKIALVATGGGSKVGATAIAAGEINASVCVRPKLLGELLFKSLYESVTHPETPKGKYVTYDLPLITKNTLNDCPDKW